MRGIRGIRPKTHLWISLLNRMNKEIESPYIYKGRNWKDIFISIYPGMGKEEEGGMETEITTRVGVGWIN